MTITAVASAQTLSKKGWYLVHLGEHEDIDTFMESHSNIHSIWHWQEDQWAVKFQNPSVSHSYANLIQLEAKRGYWIRINGEVILSENYEAWVTHVMDFEDIGKTGWHLLGTSVELAVPYFFDSALSEQGTVWQWKDQHWQVFTKGDTGEDNQFNQQYNTTFGNLRTLEAHQGFWVNYNVCGGNTPISLGDTDLENCFSETMGVYFPLEAKVACSISHLTCKTTRDLILNDSTGLERFVNLQELEIHSKNLEILSGVVIGTFPYSLEKITFRTQEDIETAPNSLLQANQINLQANGSIKVNRVKAEMLFTDAQKDFSITTSSVISLSTGTVTGGSLTTGLASISGGSLAHLTGATTVGILPINIDSATTQIISSTETITGGSLVGGSINLNGDLVIDSSLPSVDTITIITPLTEVGNNGTIIVGAVTGSTLTTVGNEMIITSETMLNATTGTPEKP